MKKMKKIVILMSLICIVSSVLLINGCGSNKQSTREGCPKGSNLANENDMILGPENGSVTIASSVGNASAEGTVLYSPVVFSVFDVYGEPRNKVCLILYTDGFWYTDNTYAITVTGTGPLNAIAVVTDDLGKAVQYWSTETLPAANSSILVSGTLTDGADQEGQTWIQVYSGTLGMNYNVDWTVEGQPAQ